MPPPAATPNSLRVPATLLSFAATRSPSAQTAPRDVTREVALKTIPKKKVKGNEESVWSEMRVLSGLDHPHIVRPPHTAVLHDAPAPARPRLSPNVFGCLSVGQVLRMVRVPDKMLPRFQAHCRRRAL